MKYTVFLFTLLFCTSALANNQKLVNQCENLQARNQNLINLQFNVYNICVFNLINSRDSIGVACEKLANGLFYQANRFLCKSFSFLIEAEEDHCRSSYLIPPLAKDVNVFRKSFSKFTCSQ